MNDAPLPAAQHYARLPKHLAAAGVLFFDEKGRVLLVKPTYRQDTWLTPGGALDPGEYPWDAARREVHEELGIELPTPRRLLTVDWVSPRPDPRPSLVAFLFDGGLLTVQQAEQQIRLPPDELAEWRFVSAGEWLQFVHAHIARRLDASIQARADGSTFYLEDGRPRPWVAPT